MKQFKEDILLEIIINRKKYYTTYDSLYNTYAFFPIKGNSIDLDSILGREKIIKWLIERNYNKFMIPLSDFKEMLDKFFTYRIVPATAVTHRIRKNFYIMDDTPYVFIEGKGIVLKSVLYKICVEYLKGNLINTLMILDYPVNIIDGELCIGCNSYAKEDIIDIFTKYLGGTYQLIVK